MSIPSFCNTTVGNYAILRMLIAAGHDCGGFFPATEAGEVICVCGALLPLAELSAAPLAEVVSR